MHTRGLLVHTHIGRGEYRGAHLGGCANAWDEYWVLSDHLVHHWPHPLPLAALKGQWGRKGWWHLPHWRPHPLLLLPAELLARAERASGAGARSHPVTRSRTKQPQTAACSRGKQPHQHGHPGCVLCAPGDSCPQLPRTEPSTLCMLSHPVHPYLHTDTASGLLCTYTHCVRALLMHTNPQARSPGANSPLVHAHSPYTRFPSADTAPPCMLTHLLHTCPVHTRSLCTFIYHLYTLKHLLCPLSFCTHILCTLKHLLYTLPVHTYTPAVHTQTSPMHCLCAHFLCIHTPLVHAHTFPYTFSPWCMLTHHLYTLSPVHIAPKAHVSSLPHPTQLQTPMGSLWDQIPSPHHRSAHPAACTGDLPPPSEWTSKKAQLTKGLYSPQPQTPYSHRILGWCSCWHSSPTCSTFILTYLISFYTSSLESLIPSPWDYPVRRWCHISHQGTQHLSDCSRAGSRGLAPTRTAQQCGLGQGAQGWSWSGAQPPSPASNTRGSTWFCMWRHWFIHVQECPCTPGHYMHPYRCT